MMSGQGWRRLTWYNPKLDPRTLETKMTDATREACEDGRYNDGTAATSGPLNDPDERHPYNLISSLCSDGLHRPALDIDNGRSKDEMAWALADLGIDSGFYVPSSTAGHFHVYSSVPFATFDAYADVLVALVDREWLEPGYLAASRNRAQTLLRPPHVRKTKKVEA